MPRPPVDFQLTTNQLLSNLTDLPPEAVSPLKHYRRAAADGWNLVEYFRRNVSRTNHYPTALERHLNRLRGMVVAHLVGAFERFLKELAATCVSHLCDFTLDGRFDKYTLKGSVVIAHFAAGTVGDALCEAETWLNCRTVNERFRSLLADPFEEKGGTFWIFPQSQQPIAEQFRFPIMATIFQIRHTAVHNLGVVTKSDAAKLRQLTRSDIQSDGVFAPTFNDVRYLKRFLDDTAKSINDRVGDRLAELLAKLLDEGLLVFDAAEKKDDLAKIF